MSSRNYSLLLLSVDGWKIWDFNIHSTVECFSFCSNDALSFPDPSALWLKSPGPVSLVHPEEEEGEGEERLAS